MTRMREAALTGRRCVLTGGLGFVGAHLAGRLMNAGAQVHIIDSAARAEDTSYDLLGLAGAEITTADLADHAGCDLLLDARPDLIFHLAGNAYAPHTTLFPDEAYANNVRTTEQVVKAALVLPECRVVFASSACVFGGTSAGPLRIADAFAEPQHYYTLTKRLAEEAIATAVPRGLDAVICRFSNIYGPADRITGRIIPRLSYQLLADEPLTLHRSNGQSVFEFLHVTDACSGFLAAAVASDRILIRQFSGGADNRSSILDLAARMSRLYDGVEREVAIAESADERPVVKFLDDSASRDELGFRTTVGLDDGLRETLAWYAAHGESVKPRFAEWATSVVPIGSDLATR